MRPWERGKNASPNEKAPFVKACSQKAVEMGKSSPTSWQNSAFSLPPPFLHLPTPSPSLEALFHPNRLQPTQLKPSNSTLVSFPPPPPAPSLCVNCCSVEELAAGSFCLEARFYFSNFLRAEASLILVLRFGQTSDGPAQMAGKVICLCTTS
ncbi:hypothetical protein L7F22_054820 [Adiantum nelumboides]|nr:hypothetical protein [Adiantum nelumboides]